MSPGRPKRSHGTDGETRNAANGNAGRQRRDEGQAEAQATEPPPEPAEERAEALLDALGQRVGALSAYAVFVLRKYAARAREEAEDIWAEAQHLRREHRS